MKTKFEAFFGSKTRDKHPETDKGGSVMMKKLFSSAVLAVMFVAGASVMKPAYAAGSADIDIVFRCTVTLSVSVVNLGAGTTSFLLGDVSAGTTVYSGTGVVIRNDSLGAISSWDMNISNSGGWTIDKAPGLDTVAIYGLFKKTQPNPADFDIINDTFSLTAKRYKDAGAFACGDYSAEGQGGVESKILPYAYDVSKSDRKLWIKMLTPLAVSNPTDMTIILTVTAQTAG